MDELYCQVPCTRFPKLGGLFDAESMGNKLDSVTCIEQWEGT